MMRRFFAIVALALFMAALPGAAGAADRKVVVFDFIVERSRGYEWVGSALSEYAAAIVDSAQGFESVDRESVNRLLRRYGYGFNESSPFEVKDKIRIKLGGDIVVEGICRVGNGGMTLEGSIVDLEEGDIVSALDFRISNFDIFAAQKQLGERMEKAFRMKIKSDTNLLLGTASKEAYEHFRKGKSLFEMEVYEQAIDKLKKALEMDERFVEPYIVLGQALMESAKPDAAKKNLERAVELSPAGFKAYFLLGMASFFMYDREAAGRYFLKAISLKDDDPDLHYRLGSLYYLERDYDGAEREYKRALEIDPEMPEGWYGLAVLYSIRVDEKKTLEAVAKAVDAGGEKMQQRIRNDKDFDWLKTKKDFIWLVGREKE
ncbi:MAG: tetratricopeptide repeat protein [bacterium]